MNVVMVGVVLLVFFLALAQGIPVQQYGHIQKQENVTNKDSLIGLEQLERQWNQFKSQYDKKYGAKEEMRRKAIFVDNLKEIAIHNALYRKGLSSFEQGLNQFTDMEASEYRKRLGGFLQVNDTQHKDIVGDQTALNLAGPWPQHVDWRQKGYVTNVKNQGHCGSCWAFSATGSLEGQHFKKTGRLTSLSEQNLVDCSGPWGNRGCNGGWAKMSFKYIIENGGIDTEDAYPYTAKMSRCRYDPNHIGAKVTSYAGFRPLNQLELKNLVAAIGPISVFIDAHLSDFKRYKTGVYDNPSCGKTGVNHVALIVGYGTDSRSGKDYWLVKNSWGTRWGDLGYIKMSRNKGDQCMIGLSVSYPVV